MVDATERLPLGRWVLILRAIQLCFAFVVLGCSAFGIYYVAYNAYCLSLFTAIATIITTIYVLVSETVATRSYNVRAILAIDILGVIFWLSSFAVLADLLAEWLAAVKLVHTWSYCYYSYCFRKRDLQRRQISNGDYQNIIAVTLAFSVIEFVLFIATLIVVGSAMSRRRAFNAPAQEVPLESGITEEHKREPVESGQTETTPAQHDIPAYSEPHGQAQR